jgi:Domain of unknown function (DUF4332)
VGTTGSGAWVSMARDSILCTGMAMKALEYLRGATADDVRRLRARGILHTNQMLHACTLEIDRRRISQKTGISEDRLLEFAHQCALLEISSLERWLTVVRRLGVTDLKIMREQDAVELQRRIVEAVGLAGAPTLSTVQYWIGQARSIDMIEEYAPSAMDVSPSLIGSTASETTRTQV